MQGVDIDFRMHIDRAFQPNLDRLIEISLFNKDNSKSRKFINKCKVKYRLGCPSRFYDHASKELKDEYDWIHENICFLLFKNYLIKN